MREFVYAHILGVCLILGLYLTPLSPDINSRFRICYSFVTPEVLDMAMARLDRIVGKIRRYHWDDLKVESLIRDIL
jgi:hypothetical protein